MRSHVFLLIFHSDDEKSMHSWIFTRKISVGTKYGKFVERVIIKNVDIKFSIAQYRNIRKPNN